MPILGLVGMGISSYLTYVDLKGIKPVCLPLSDCNAVLSSAYSHFLGVPLALLGLLMYTVLTCLGLLLLRKKNEGGLMALATFSLALTGTLYSGYLFYLQLSEIHAFCTWCLASALVVTAITALSLRRLFTSRQYSAKTHTSA